MEIQKNHSAMNKNQIPTENYMTRKALVGLEIVTASLRPLIDTFSKNCEKYFKTNPSLNSRKIVMPKGGKKEDPSTRKTSQMAATLFKKMKHSHQTPHES